MAAAESEELEQALRDHERAVHDYVQVERRIQAGLPPARRRRLSLLLTLVLLAVFAAPAAVFVGRVHFVPASACPNAANTPGGSDGAGGCWPYAGNTGVPAGTTLTTYTGPCSISGNNVVIDSKIIDCGGMQVFGTNLIIRKSQMAADTILVNAPTASVTVEDSDINGSDAIIASVGDRNVTVRRSDIQGSQHGINCYGNCTVEDNWIHDLHDGAALGWHQNAFISNGGSDMTVRHNSLACTGGCTADLALLPDDDLDNIAVDHNLMVAAPTAAYCFYGGGTDGAKPGTASNIVVTNNVWQRGANNQCATFGPVTYFDVNATGNVWTNNKWADGAVMNPVF